MEFCSSLNHEKLTFELVDKIRQFPLFTEWENAGGQIIPSDKIQELFTNIKKGEIKSWKSVHRFYDQCQSEYEKYKVRYALYLLEQLYSRPIEEFTVDVYRNVTEDVAIVADDIYNASLQSREKDYTDYYRKMTYVSEREMQNVIGILDENSFLCQLNSYTEKFKSDIFQIFLGLTK